MRLRRGLCRLVSERPQATLFDICEESMMWCIEDRPRENMARSRYMGSDPVEAQRDPSTAASQAILGKPESITSGVLIRERFLEGAVGRCPEVDIHIASVPVRCLLDTGSKVSMLTESFFREHLHGEDKDMYCTAKWLKITAANKLPLPYLGYVELDIRVMGLVIPECGFLIVCDGGVTVPNSSPPSILRMNIIPRFSATTPTGFQCR